MKKLQQDGDMTENERAQEFVMPKCEKTTEMEKDKLAGKQRKLTCNGYY